MNLNEEKQILAAKKVKYTVSIIYLIIFAFIVGGSYINQKNETPVAKELLDEVDVIWPEPDKE